MDVLINILYGFPILALVAILFTITMHFYETVVGLIFLGMWLLAMYSAGQVVRSFL